jgi:bacillithiol biosynthesis cysteine-adding enzyme BshC
MPEFLATLPEKVEIFEQAYTSGKTLSDAVRMYMHALFPDEKLICLDADDKELKQEFISVMEADLIDFAHLDLVKKANEAIENLGYKPQIHAREINFFYLQEGFRERIEFHQDRYTVLNSQIAWTKMELQKELHDHPERFSPNVVLRPIYQETILPNLAYLGGGAEVSYWLQLKGIFDAHEVPYPILLPRNFALILSPQQQQRIQKLNVSIPDLFLDENRLKKKFVEQHSENTLDFQSEQQLIDPIMDQVLAKIAAVDKTLEAAVLAEKHKWLSGLENLEKRMKKAEERNQDTQVQQLLGLKAKLFPEGHWQERHDNLLNFYLNYPQIITDLLNTLDALNFELYVLELA